MKNRKPKYERRPYRIGGFERKLHDPWGNKRGNRGGIVQFQYQVAQTELDSYFGDTSINSALWYFDKPRLLEHNFGRFVRTNRRIEKLRR